MSNQVLEVIKARRSVRAYKNTPLTDEQFTALIEAALEAPSGMNRQPWRVSVVKNKSILTELEQDIVQCFEKTGETSVVERLKSRNNKIFYDAPAVFFISVPEDSRPLTDAGIMVENIAIAAKSLGLDSVILGLPAIAFNGETAPKWKEKLEFENGYNFAIAIAVGYADIESSPHEIDRTKVKIIE